METILANIWHLEDGEDLNRQEMELADMMIKEENNHKAVAASVLLESGYQQ